jgi:hypothetical protein
VKVTYRLDEDVLTPGFIKELLDREYEPPPGASDEVREALRRERGQAEARPELRELSEEHLADLLMQPTKDVARGFWLESIEVHPGKVIQFPKERTCACCGQAWRPSKGDPAVDKMVVSKGERPAITSYHRRCHEHLAAKVDEAIARDRARRESRESRASALRDALAAARSVRSSLRTHEGQAANDASDRIAQKIEDILGQIESQDARSADGSTAPS